MIKDISIEELENFANPILVDVRSEGEFAEDTIKGAVNIPLFDNQERAEVGTVYTHVSPSAARELGLKLVSPKLPDLVKQVTDLSVPGRPLVMFCWRGGLRSKMFATMVDLMVVPVYRLQGGYKVYRQKIVEYFQQELPFHVIVLRGNTGTGKTEMLKRLRQHGYPAIDLEKLANNRGSVFGAVGLGSPPSQKAFESALFHEIKECERFPYLVVECESRRIGRVTIPDTFFRAMQSGTQVLLYDSLANRVQRLVPEYFDLPGKVVEMDAALDRLVKTLGHAKVNILSQLLQVQNYQEFTRLLLVEYYDLLYGYPNQPSDQYDACINHANPDEAVRELEHYFDQRFSRLSDKPVES